MKQDSATQSDFDLTFHVIDSLLQTPICSDQLVPFVNDLSSHVTTDSIDDMLQVLQDMVPACKPSTNNMQNITPSLYDDLFLPSASKNCTATPQLETNLDDIVLQELDAISSELDYFANYRRGQKVKKRLFSGNFAEEPAPKRRRVSSCEEVNEDFSVFTDSSCSEFTWISSARRS